MKISYESLRAKYAVACKQIQFLEKMNKDMFKENHQANVRIMQLEAENAELRRGMCFYPRSVGSSQQDSM